MRHQLILSIYLRQFKWNEKSGILDSARCDQTSRAERKGPLRLTPLLTSKQAKFLRSDGNKG
jgi:hypothetical protein